MTEQRLSYSETTDALDIRIQAHLKYSSLHVESILNDLLYRNPQYGRICDLGCGSGNFSELFARKCQLYVGLDANPGLLKQASLKCTRHGLGNALFMQWDMNDNFPFVPGSFDFLFSGFSAYYVDDAEKLLRNCHELLSAGGEVCLLGPLPGNAIELDHLGEALFGIRSTQEKDLRIARLQGEFAPLAERIFGNCTALERDFSLNFPDSAEYARYYKATPQYIELEKAHGSPDGPRIEDGIQQLTKLRLTKKTLFLSAKKRA